MTVSVLAVARSLSRDRLSLPVLSAAEPPPLRASLGTLAAGGPLETLDCCYSGDKEADKAQDRQSVSTVTFRVTLKQQKRVCDIKWRTLNTNTGNFRKKISKRESNFTRCTFPHLRAGVVRRAHCGHSLGCVRGDAPSSEETVRGPGACSVCIEEVGRGH